MGYGVQDFIGSTSVFQPLLTVLYLSFYLSSKPQLRVGYPLRDLRLPMNQTSTISTGYGAVIDVCTTNGTGPEP